MSLLMRRLCCSRMTSSWLVSVKPSAHLSTASRIPPTTPTHYFPLQHGLFKRDFSSQWQWQWRIPLVKCQLPQSPQLRLQVRGVVNVSKRRGKKKTVKAVAKRFHRTGSGKLKYWPAGKVHNMLCKSRNHRQRLRKPRYASKTQLKTLNKMLSGW